MPVPSPSWLIGFFRFLGSVFSNDLVRSSRRRRHTVLRTVYCLLLSGLLFWVAYDANLGHRTSFQLNGVSGTFLFLRVAGRLFPRDSLLASL